MTNFFRALLFLGFVVVAFGDCGQDCACTRCLGDGNGCVCDINGMVMNEVHLDQERRLQWVEFVNVGPTTSTAGYVLALESGEPLHVFGEQEIKAGQGLVLYDQANSGKGKCNAGSPGLAKSTGSVFVAAKWSMEQSRQRGLTAALVLLKSDGTLVSRFEIKLDGSPTQLLDPEVLGSSPSSHYEAACTPGVRLTGGHFRRLLISEVMVDAGLNDFNQDGSVGELSDLAAHGMEDAFIEIVNQECYPIDIGGFEICVSCPPVCEPTFDNNTNIVGCFEFEAPPCTLFHEFPAQTMLPPGGAALIFAGYGGTRGGKGAGVTFSLEESAAFGYSVVQIASIPVGYQESHRYQYDTFANQRGQIVVAHKYGLRQLLPILPCLTCAGDDIYCESEPDDQLLLVGNNPQIVYSVRDGDYALVTASLDVLDIKSGVSFTHVPGATAAEFVPHCITTDTCACQTDCSSPGYTNDMDQFVRPHVVGTKTVYGVDGSCVHPGTLASVKTVLKNTGDQSAFHVQFHDEAFENSVLVPGTVRVNNKLCNIVRGNGFNDTDVLVEIEELCICDDRAIVVEYEVFIGHNFDCGSETSTTTQGRFSWSNGPEPLEGVTSAAVAPYDLPTTVNFCFAAHLEVVDHAFQASVSPGSTATASLTVHNAGDSPVCDLAFGFSSDFLDCTLREGQVTSIPQGKDSTFWYDCDVPKPYPCKPDLQSVLVTVSGSNTDGTIVTSGAVLEVLVIDDVLVSLKASCSSPDANGCCGTAANISYDGLISNRGDRDICEVAFQYGFSQFEVGHLVVGSVRSLFCDILIGNSAADTEGPVEFACDVVKGGASQAFSFVLWTDDPAVVTSHANTGDSTGWVRYTSDGTPPETAFKTTSDTRVADKPTAVCFSAAPVPQITKACSALPAANVWEQASKVRYSLEVSNTGTQVADFFLSDIVSPFYTFESTSTDGCVFEEGMLNCRFESLAPGQSGWVTYVASINSNSPDGTPVETAASVLATAGTPVAKYEAWSDVPVCDVTPMPVVTLWTSMDESVLPGGSASVRLVVKNSGEDGSNQLVSGFVLTESPEGCAPSNWEFQPSADDWVVAKQDGQWMFHGPALNVGETASVSYDCSVGYRFDWDASYVSHSTTLTYGDNWTASSSDASHINANVNIIADKSTPSSSVAPGDSIWYSIKIVNTGARDAHDVRIRDIIPPGVPLGQPVVCSGSSQISIEQDHVTTYSCDYDSLLGDKGLSLGDLPALGGCITVGLHLQVDCPVANDLTTLTNEAIVSYFDPNADVDECEETRSLSNLASTSVSVHSYEFITVEMMADTTIVSPGGSISYWVRMTNGGNRNVNSAVFRDTISDQFLGLQVGTVKAEDATVVSGNTYMDSPDYLEVDLDVLAGTCGGVFDENIRVVQFTALVSGGPNSPSGSVASVCTQGSLTYQSLGNQHTVPTDDVNTTTIEDQTCTAIDHNPYFIITTESSPARLTTGDIVTFNVSIANNGNLIGTDLIYSGLLDDNLELVQGSISIPGSCDSCHKTAVLSGNRVNDAFVRVVIGTLDLTDSFSLSFQARVVDYYSPSSEGETFSVSLENQVGTSEIIYSTTTHTRQLVDVGPIIVATLTDDLSVSNGARPGQTIQYTLSISNTGNAVSKLVASDPLSAFHSEGCVGPNLVLLPGTVDASRGRVTVGNRPQDKDIGVDIGRLAPWESVTILFEASVSDPFACQTLEVVNQASVLEMYTSQVTLSDDPNTSPIGDETKTPVSAYPLVSAVKSASVKGSQLSMDPEARPSVGPGDVIIYELSIANDGNQASFGVTVTDALDRSLTLLPDSLLLNGAPVDPNTIVDVDTGAKATAETVTFQVPVGSVPGSDTSILIFEAVVTDRLSTSSITNQAIIDGTNFDQIFSTAPGGGTSDVPTSIDVNALPELDVQLTWSQVQRIESLIAPGDQMEYQLTISNAETSRALAANVIVVDEFEGEQIVLNVGSVKTSSGTVVQGNTNKDTSLKVNIPSIPIGQTVTITYTVSLQSVFPAGVASVSNQVVVYGDNVKMQVSRDPSTGLTNDPTVTPVNAAADVVTVASVTYDSRPVDATNPIPVGKSFQVEVQVANNGNQEAANVEVRIPIDPNTKFVAGSVSGDGTVRSGNFVGDTGPVVVSLGTIGQGLGGLKTIRFTSVASDPFTGKSAETIVLLMVTQEYSAPISQTFTFPVDASSRIGIASTCDFCLKTGTRCNTLNPGEQLQVSATLTNSGNQNAFGVVFLSNPGSPFITRGGPFNVAPASMASLISFESYENGSLAVRVPSLSGEGGTLSFSYILEMTNGPVSGGVTQNLFVWANEGLVEYSAQFSCADSQSRSLSGGELTVRTARTPRQEAETCPPPFRACGGGGFSPNIVNVCGGVSVTMIKDKDKSGDFTTGDVVQYEVELYIQSSCDDLRFASFTDTPDAANTKLVAGSVRPSLGRVISGNNQGDGQVLLSFGRVPGARETRVVVVFEATIIRSVPVPTLLGNNAFVTVEAYGNFDVAPIDPPVYFSTPRSAFSSASSLSVSGMVGMWVACWAAFFWL